MFHQHAQRILRPVVAYLALLPSPGLAHRGPLDSIGCHPSFSKVLGGGTAGYHCHWGPLSGRSFASKEEAVKAFAEIRQTTPSAPEVNWRTVTRVIDGNSIVLDDGEEVELLGVMPVQAVRSSSAQDRSGEAAKDLVQQMVEGEKVRLEYDPKVKESNGAPPAYVYLEGGMLLNSEIIRRGYGRAASDPDYRYKEEFAEYEREAREAGRGLWRKN